MYRLAKALTGLGAAGSAPAVSAAAPQGGLDLRILVDDLAAFHALCPAVEPGRAVQTVNGWTIVAWDAGRGDRAPELFRAKRPRTVIECFACGRPEWYEEILFDESDGDDRLIIDLEYLTAEDWAADFHRLPSRTRSGRVKKAMFLPGFTADTGGLILDAPFMALREAYRDEGRREELRRALLAKIAARAGRPEAALPAPQEAALPAPQEAALPAPREAFWITVFSYERDYAEVVRDLAAEASRRPILALAAAGKSARPLLEAWEGAGRPFPIVELPFLDQETWDEVLLASDFLIVRGEDSLSRAALSGKPFLWHAYPLEDAHQLVKVRALLERARPSFQSADFLLLERQWLSFNGSAAGGASTAGFAEFLRRAETGSGFAMAFRAWSDSLIKNGDLARSLLTFIRDFR